MNNLNEELSKLNPVEFATILHESRLIGVHAATALKAMDVIYPCGFAWIVFKIRKNHKHSKALAEFCYWDDYRKAYLYGANGFTMSQNMDYKEAVLREVAKYFNSKGISVHVETRID